MTQAALKLTTRVLPGKRIEVTAPELTEGDEVEIFIALPASSAPKRRSVLDIIESLPPGPRQFKTPEEADRYLQEERDAWER
jgi:hypothetical protein